MIENKIHQFNESLLQNGSVESDCDCSDSETDNNVESVTNDEPNDTSPQQYYTSAVWGQKVDGILAAIGNIDQPRHPNVQASYAHTQSSTVQTHSIVQQLSINPIKSNRITSWHFPPQYSQSTLNGRLGSNACTFIALTYSKFYFSSPESLSSSQALSNTWMYRVLAARTIGQQFYDKCASNAGQLYGVREAALKMEQTRALGCINISAELPASIIKEPIPSAALPHYFGHARNISKTACIYVINDKTVAFIPTQQGITLFDSHFHGTSGAFLAMAPADAAWELLSWFKAVNSIPHNLGTVTSVTF